MHAKSLDLFLSFLISTWCLTPYILECQTAPMPSLKYVDKAQLGEIALVDSLAVPTAELWRQTANLQDLGDFVIVHDVVLPDANTYFADPVLTIIHKGSGVLSRLNINNLPGIVPGKGYVGAMKVGEDLLIRYSDGLIRYAPFTGQIRQFHPESDEEKQAAYPLMGVGKLALVDKEHFLIARTSYETGQTSFALCDTTGQRVSLQSRNYALSPPRSHYNKPLFSDYSDSVGLHAILLSDSMQLTLVPLDTADEQFITYDFDLRHLLEECAYLLHNELEIDIPALLPIGMKFEDSEVIILFRNDEEWDRKLLLKYDYHQRSAHLVPINNFELFASSWMGHQIMAINNAVPGKTRWLKTYSY
ncbi:MAG: hypothetical protein R2824_34925 [Saprospiraceae bacterium]|nr:hypothetical protein [Lewinella sp.]